MTAYISDCSNYYSVTSGESDNAYLTADEACANCNGTSRKFNPNLGWGIGGPCHSASNIPLQTLPIPPVYISDGRRIFVTADKTAAANNGYKAFDTPCEACRNCEKELYSDPDTFLWTEVGMCDNIDEVSLPLELDSNGQNWFYNFNSFGKSASTPLEACHNSTSIVRTGGAPAGSCAAVVENFTMPGSSSNWLLFVGILVVIGVIAALAYYSMEKKKVIPPRPGFKYY